MNFLWLNNDFSEILSWMILFRSKHNNVWETWQVFYWNSLEINVILIKGINIILSLSNNQDKE